MVNGISASLSALYAFGNKLSNTAHNVANVNTNGYKKTVATITEDSNSLPQVNLMQSDQPGAIILEDGLLKETSNVDLAEEFPQMMIAQRGYEANIRALQVQNDLLKSAIDMIV
ncbi:MAG TPA: flagellar basal body rod C-terminal domain-containing protein [Syntrophorhabdaceae bacterium]|nr:flagellar basal body rod C-terminal domain-containing protein [Syntrophorhabdaceae bacterium]